MIGEKQNSPWLTCATGLAFGVVLGGSLTLAFAPALPVAVGVIATTTIIWGFIGHLAEEYQKKNLKNDYSASPATSTRQFSGGRGREEREGARGKPTFSTLSPIMTSGITSQYTSRTELRFESDEVSDQVGDLEDDTQVCVKRRLFGSPDPVGNSPDLHEFTFSAKPQWDATIFYTANNDQTTPQPSSITRKRPHASPSPSLSVSPIYMNAMPKAALVEYDGIVSAELVCIPSINTSQRDLRSVWMPDTPGRENKSAIRIEAARIFESRRQMVSISEHNPLDEVRLCGDDLQPSIVRAAWKKMESEQLRLPTQ